MTELVVCESLAAILTHLRRVTSLTPIRLSGHMLPRPLTLCGTEAVWDTKIQVSSRVTCRTCSEKFQEMAPADRGERGGG